MKKAQFLILLWWVSSFNIVLTKIVQEIEYFLAIMPFASIVTNFTGITPEILAKPGNALINVLKENLGLPDQKRVVFMGDSYVWTLTDL